MLNVVRKNALKTRSDEPKGSALDWILYRFFGYVRILLAFNPVIIHRMKRKKKGARERSTFELIRKPVAPPSKTFGDSRPEERIHPSERKIKHKKKNSTAEE